MKENTQIIVDRWEATGLLRGLTTQQKWAIAPVLEQIMGASVDQVSFVKNLTEAKQVVDFMVPATIRVMVEVDRNATAKQIEYAFKKFLQTGFAAKVTPKLIKEFAEFYRKNPPPPDHAL